MLTDGRGKNMQSLYVFKETHTKRHATQHDCLPSLLSDGDKGIEIVCSEEKNICLRPTRAAKTEQKSLVLRTNQPKEAPSSFVLFGSPFTPVSTDSRGHPYLLFSLWFSKL
jgi:hypothetical protein